MIQASLLVYICWNMPVGEVLAKYPFLAEYVPPSGNILSITEETPKSLRFRWPSELALDSATPVASQNGPPSIAAELTQTDGLELAYNDCLRDARTSLVSDAFRGTI